MSLFNWIRRTHWVVGNITIYLWPFIYVAVFILALILYDYYG